MLSKEYQQDYTGEFKVTTRISRGVKTEERSWIPQQIQYDNKSYIALCIVSDDFSVQKLNLDYPTFSTDLNTDFTVHNNFYTYGDISNIIPFRPMFTEQSMLLYVTAFYKFETVFMFGFNAETIKEQQHINDVLRVYNDTEFVLVSATGYAEIPELWKYNTNFHQISRQKFRTLV